MFCRNLPAIDFDGKPRYVAPCNRRRCVSKDCESFERTMSRKCDAGTLTHCRNHFCRFKGMCLYAFEILCNIMTVFANK